MEDSGLYDQLMQRAAQQVPPSASGDVWGKMTKPMPPQGGMGGGATSGPPPIPHPAQTPMPPVPSPSGAGGPAPAAQRYVTGEAVKQAVANNWTPNPTLLRATMGR